MILSEVAENLADLMDTDYRVRIQIKNNLETNYIKNRYEDGAPHIAFQVAFCYLIGFGAKSDSNKCHIWLEKSNKQSYDLELEKEAVRPANSKNGKMWWRYGLMKVDLTHQYQKFGPKKLSEACKECQREVRDMSCVFGELHFIPLSLYTTIGNMLHGLGEYAESKALRMRIRDQLEKADGIDHPYYIHAIVAVLKSQAELRELTEMHPLVKVFLREFESTDVAQSSMAKFLHNLVSTYPKQEQWKELFAKFIEMSASEFGQEHPQTLTSIACLASLFNQEGRWTEAEELLVQVIESKKRVLGEEHPDILDSKCHLASTYEYQGRWKEAEVLMVQVMQMKERVYGQEHPSTLTSKSNLASTYSK